MRALFICFFIVMLVSARAQVYPTNSVLKHGVWYKVAIEKNGVYQISYDQFRKMGFDPGKTDPRNIQIFGNPGGMLPQANSAAPYEDLQENAIEVTGSADGKFDKSDRILFYAEGPDHSHFDAARNTFFHETNLYAKQNFYFITVGDGPGKRITSSNDLGAGFPEISEYNDYGFYEKEEFNDLESGRVWYGDRFGISTSELSLDFPVSGITNRIPITMISDVMGKSYTNSSLDLSFNGVAIAQQTLPPIPNTRYGVKGIDLRDTLKFNATDVSADSKNIQTIKYKFNRGTGASEAYLDNILFSFSRKLSFASEQIDFVSQQSLANAVSRFIIGNATTNTTVWDVSNRLNPVSQNITIEGSSAAFSTSTSDLKRFIGFNSALSPTLVGKVDNQDLRGATTPNLVIVTNSLFTDEASRLKAHRESTGWTVLLVTTDQIYNEFSSGRQDVTAIRDFVRHLYRKNPEVLKALLLFGKSSYDYKDRIPGNSNFVPTYESRNSLHPLLTYSSDDYFAFLEPSEGNWGEDPLAIENHTLDIGVGRLPVKTSDEARAVVDKIIAYETDKKQIGSWRKQIVFVADDGNNEDGYTSLHQSQSDQLSQYVEDKNGGVIAKKLFIGSFAKTSSPKGETIPEFTKELVRAFDKGALVINYTGHGNERQWGDEKVFSDLDIVELDNEKYPFLVTATCEFGRHDNPREISGAELLVKQAKGGAIGMVTTARPVNATTNFNLNRAFYDALFQVESNRYLPIGDVFRRTKNNSTSGVSNRNFSLLADPSMTLALPPLIAVLESLETSSGSDTLNASSSVVAQGEIRNSENEVQTNFNGQVELTLFNKPEQFETIGKNDPAFHYTQWSNALFRGKASVVDGKFTINFMLPKDISSEIVQGKVGMYASDPSQSIDALGSFTDFKIGGAAADITADTNPPIIHAFVGDSTFVNGGVASADTDLVVFLDDDSGINISSDHPLQGILDDGLETFALNEYFVGSQNDPTSGWITFPMNDLAPGPHSIKIKAWDIFDNPAEGTVDFIVTDGDGIVIESFGNYPNPFTEKTTLFFTHNRSGDDLQAQLFIQKTTGEMVNRIDITIPASDYQVTVMELTNEENNKKLSAGLYLARLVVRSLTNGSKNEQVTKLIILN